jgi:hypothetical protein
MHYAHNFTWNHQLSIQLRLVQEIRAGRVHLQREESWSPSVLMELWTVFGLTSNAAHKNQRAERVVSCSYHNNSLQNPA